MDANSRRRESGIAPASLLAKSQFHRRTQYRLRSYRRRQGCQGKSPSRGPGGYRRHAATNSDSFRPAIVFSWPPAVDAVVLSTGRRPLVIPTGGHPPVILSDTALSCRPERAPPSCHPERSRGIWLRMGGAPRPQADVSATLRSARHDKRNELAHRDAVGKATSGPHELHRPIPAALDPATSRSGAGPSGPLRRRGPFLRLDGQDAPRPEPVRQHKNNHTTTRSQKTQNPTFLPTDCLRDPASQNVPPVRVGSVDPVYSVIADAMIHNIVRQRDIA